MLFSTVAIATSRVVEMVHGGTFEPKIYRSVNKPGSEQKLLEVFPTFITDHNHHILDIDRSRTLRNYQFSTSERSLDHTIKPSFSYTMNPRSIAQSSLFSPAQRLMLAYVAVVFVLRFAIFYLIFSRTLSLSTSETSLDHTSKPLFSCTVNQSRFRSLARKLQIDDKSAPYGAYVAFLSSITIIYLINHPDKRSLDVPTREDMWPRRHDPLPASMLYRESEQRRQAAGKCLLMMGPQQR